MLSKEMAVELAAALGALGIEAIAKSTDFAPKNPDGSYVGTVEKIWHVHAVVRDAKRENTVVRRLEAACSATDVAAEMQADLKQRVKATRARIRAERGCRRARRQRVPAGVILDRPARQAAPVVVLDHRGALAVSATHAKRGPKPRDPSGAGSPSTVWLTPADREALAALKAAKGLSVADVLRLGIAAARRRKA